jgi:1-aminocyclopropane-1-carboxylate deaminase
MKFWDTNITIQNINHPLAKKNNVVWDIQREDFNHPYISGNKFRKLKYNIQHCIQNKIHHCATFGGPHSNHIAAFAYACKKFNINGVGFIHGEHIKYLSPTLIFANEMGLKLIYLSSSDYKSKNIPKEFSHYFVIPEGGANELGLKGTKEILNHQVPYDYIFTPLGTGNTLTGLILSSKNTEKIIGVSSLKGAENIQFEILKNLQNHNYYLKNWEILNNYHMGGYAKFHPEIVRIYNFYLKNYNIELDPIYTCKMMFAIEDLLLKKQINNCKILCIHTGGLQGVTGFKNRYQKQWNKTLDII